MVLARIAPNTRSRNARKHECFERFKYLVPRVQEHRSWNGKIVQDIRILKIYYSYKTADGMKIEASSTSSRKTEGVSESPSSQKQQHNCSVCHNSAIKVAFHPNLGVPLCLPCNTKRAAPKNAEGDKGISSCLWCGSSIPGLMMVQCGQCRSHFCNDCLSSNFGASLFK